MASENEGKRETLADIVAEMRRGTKLPGYWRSCDLNKILKYHADRIEAAAKREKAEIEANALSVGGVVEAARHKPGNAAAMREACEAIMSDARGFRFYDERMTDDQFEDAVVNDAPDYTVLRYLWIKSVKLARAALSSPERNCDAIDLPTDCNSQKIHVSDRVHMLNTDCRGDHEWDDEVCSLEYVGEGGGDLWLIHGKDGVAWACECEVLAPAEERKGECDDA